MNKPLFKTVYNENQMNPNNTILVNKEIRIWGYPS